MTEHGYIREQLRESFRVVDTCLSCIYAGETHMYRALAGQLRLMLCDTQRRRDNSLIAAAYPKLEVSALKGIDWSCSQAGELRLQQPKDGTTLLSQMPFEITVYSNGLAVADLSLGKDHLLPIGEWCEQRLTVHPMNLSCKTVVRTVADKGGGAHVDASASAELKYMYQATPANRTFAELFVLGLGRFVQGLGEHLFQYKGVRVADVLTTARHEKLSLVVAAHRDYVEALSNPPTGPARKAVQAGNLGASGGLPSSPTPSTPPNPRIDDRNLYLSPG